MEKANHLLGLRRLLLPVLIAISAAPALAAIKREVIEYRQGDTALEGYLVYDAGTSEKRPGILVVHEWMGLGENAKMRADMLAQMGYIAFAPDMYGKGVRAKDHEEAATLSGIYRNDRNLMRGRIGAGLGVLKNHKLTDASRIAAIGYCFGGTSVLELARSGADIRGVVSFHGALDTPMPAEPDAIRAKILVCQGGEDTFTLAAVPAFQEEMRKAKANWQMNVYGGAVHSFTVKEAGNDPSTGMAYNEQADRRSWDDLRRFLAELFRK